MADPEGVQVVRSNLPSDKIISFSCGIFRKSGGGGGGGAGIIR